MLQHKTISHTCLDNCLGYFKGYVEYLQKDPLKNLFVMSVFFINNIIALGLSSYALSDSNNDDELAPTSNAVLVTSKWAIMLNIIYFSISAGFIMGPKSVGYFMFKDDNHEPTDSTKRCNVNDFENMMGIFLFLGQSLCIGLESSRYSEPNEYKANELHDWQLATTFVNIGLWSTMISVHSKKEFSKYFSKDFDSLDSQEQMLNRLNCLNHGFYAARMALRVCRIFLSPEFGLAANSIDSFRFIAYFSCRYLLTYSPRIAPESNDSKSMA
ncbi:MAG: hypothetical protein VXX85_04655 [Candidatus Margulisiibacteriota bacterium]|nr:hypothetical protein [Candidatus Margulisiibacteriota bacterium]